jgi:hypothetical protein
MTQNVSTGNATYPILLCPTADATANQGAKTGIFGANVKVNPSTAGLYFSIGGGIYCIGTKSTYKMISFIDNTADTYGNGIAIGGGGAVILGGGEAATNIQTEISSGGDEVAIIASDGAVKVYTNVQSNKTTLSTFNTDGTFTPKTSGSIASGNANAVTGGTVYNYVATVQRTLASIPNKVVEKNISVAFSGLAAQSKTKLKRLVALNDQDCAVVTSASSHEFCQTNKGLMSFDTSIPNIHVHGSPSNGNGSSGYKISTSTSIGSELKNQLVFCDTTGLNKAWINAVGGGGVHVSITATGKKMYYPVTTYVSAYSYYYVSELKTVYEYKITGTVAGKISLSDGTNAADFNATAYSLDASGTWQIPVVNTA